MSAGDPSNKLLQHVQDAARQAASSSFNRLAHSSTALTGSQQLCVNSQGVHTSSDHCNVVPASSAGQPQKLTSVFWGLQPNSSALSASFATSTSKLTPTSVVTAPLPTASPGSTAGYTSSSPTLRRTSAAIPNYQAVGLPSFQDLLQSYRKNLGSVTTAVGRLTQVTRCSGKPNSSPNTKQA